MVKNQVVTETNFQFTNLKNVYKGKVRDVYNIDNKFLVMVVTDRISAFDVVLPVGIQHKGQVLNQIASLFLDETADIVANWKIETPDEMVTVGHYVEPFKIEMVIRNYLTGHAWREYKSGKREICGEKLPDGMRENQKFEKPIITPTTKAVLGHDQDISKEEIIENQLATRQEYAELEKFTFQLFERGTQIAAQRDLILVDTKYEFGKKDGKIFLIDEIHTPDSSRYFYLNDYQEKFEKNQSPRQLSKEFVREWLINQGFQGREGDKLPNFSTEFISQVSNRYVELFENITGKKFLKPNENQEILQRIEKNINVCLSKLK